MNDRDAQVALAGAVAAIAVQEKWTPDYTEAVADRAQVYLAVRPRVGVADVFRAIVSARATLARGTRTVATGETLAGLEHD